MRKFLSLLLITLFIFSCNTSDDSLDASKPDPEGTITTNITDGTWSPVLYKGPNSDISQHTCVIIVFNMSIPSGNIQFYTGGTNDCSKPQSQWWNISTSYGGEAADIGEVNGLGNVNTKPTVGYSNSAALIPGHGYVIRWRKTDNYPVSSQPYFYHRFYVKEYSINTSGGIMGVLINFQGPF